MNYKIILITLSYLLAASIEAYNFDIDRSKFIKATKYFEAKDYKKFNDLKRELKNYPLHAELEYKNLHRKKNINNDEVIKFISKYKKSYLSEKAYVNLIYRLSSKNKFDKLIANYVDIGSVELQCLYIRAKIKKKYFLNIEKEIIPVWLSSKSQPKSCDFIFKWFYYNKKLSDELVWQRIKMALNFKNYKLARYLVRFLSNKDKSWAQILLKVHLNPKKNLLSNNFKKENRYRDTILSYGLDRIARKNYLDAKKYLSIINSEYSTSYDFYNKKMLEIFITALLTNQKNIIHDKDFIRLENKNLKFNLALAQYAIFNSYWSHLLNSIEKLPMSISKEEKWIYWKSKALIKTGENIKAQKNLEKLRKNRSYYGFLASSLLNKKISIINIAYKSDITRLSILSSSYEVKRLHELFFLGRKREARKELQFIFQNFDNQSINDMSVLFKKWGWNIGAILAYGRTKSFNDIEARFPVMYEKYFNKYSENNLQKSLLLGISRKESIFIQYAKSSTGAIGIMQVMPKTAYWILKRTKSKNVSRNYLYNENMNIFLGSYYFKYLLKKKKSYVEAIASYNAGPTIVKKWKKLNNSSEDAWVEFIPYSETRKYVKLVIEYSLVYDWILNKKNTIRVSQLININ